MDLELISSLCYVKILSKVLELKIINSIWVVVLEIYGIGEKVLSEFSKITKNQQFVENILSWQRSKTKTATPWGLTVVQKQLL